MSATLNPLLNQDNKLITESYFDAQREAHKLYGENTVIFIELGSFYEVYESDTLGHAKEIASILNIALTKKNKKIEDSNERNPFLCGIPTVSLDKHIDKLTQDNKWTIILVSQVGEIPNMRREVFSVISPGTNVDYLKNDNYNYIASIYAEKNKEGIIYAGLSLIDLGTGKVLSFENYGTKNDKELPIDEILNLIKINTSSEIIFTFNGFSESEKNDVISTITSGKILFSEKDINDLKNTLKISYQNELLKEIFNINSFLSPIEELDLERSPSALNALCILINFISDHNYKIIKNLKRPEHVKSNNYLYLGNNALEQLNIIGPQKEVLVNLINNGVSAVGKRFISDQLMNPLVDKEEITKRYTLSNLFFNKDLRNDIRLNLREIYDVERLLRKVSLKTISPAELHNLYLSFQTILNINNILDENGNFENILIEDSYKNEMITFIDSIEKTFDLKRMSIFSLNNINANFINWEYFNSKEALDLNDSLNNLYKKIIKVGISLDKLVDPESIFEYEISDPRSLKINNTTIGYNDTEGFYYEITEKRLSTIKNLEKELKEINGDFSLKKLKGSSKIYFKETESLSNDILLIETKILNMNKEKFLEYVSLIKFNSFEIIIHFISYLEFLINNAILKDKYGYCVPEIIETDGSNFIEAIDLRHAIIERLYDSELYVPNDIVLGNKSFAQNKAFTDEIFEDKEVVNGIALYGLNSSGKSSSLKSLGISLILAQAGIFVPATKFRYTIFESIFTRITSFDNLHKGLSTFAIEMLEMKNVFNRINNKSLILIDELASGSTETISALAIAASALSVISERNALFIFATHLHQLKDVKEVVDIETLVNAHIEVSYDEDKELLIYNRKIRKGQGSSIYGLEFAKYMQMDKSFLERAYKIRSKLSYELDTIESITREKRSRYNKDKFLTYCEICGEKAIEEHHINQQKEANENGLIGHVHKNNKSNLVDLCIDCHDKVHSGEIIIEGWKKTSEGNMLIFNKKVL